ncbi:hypothetical protein MPSEU_000753800 [Mayamaea pseudoterrestris]|nr:hypothetical protein MPSEU_000753800 [Mayamaea pseudoterrestris]
MKRQSSYYSIQMLLLLLLLVHCIKQAAAAVTNTTTITLAPSRVKSIKGKYSTAQSISTLGLQQQSNQQDTWKNYVELSGSATDSLFKIQFDLQAASTTLSSDSQIQSMTVKLNSIGLPYNQQKRIYKLRNFATNKWVTIGSNRNAPNWSWYYQTMTLTSSDYYNYNKGPAVSIQISSSNKLDVCNVDYLVVEIVYASSSSNSPVASPPSPAAPASSWWQPKASDQLTWQYQLQGVIDTSVDADIFDIDLFAAAANKTVVSTLHAQNKRVVCYFSAGTYEAWNTDWSKYFPFVSPNVAYTGSQPPFANNMADWPGERWLDVSRLELLQPIMTARMKLAKHIGCDAVDPDNLDAYSNTVEVGLPRLTATQQLVYNRWIAETAHSLGLGVGLKNDLGQLKDLVDFYDFAVNEQCFQYDECDKYTNSFIARDKAVFGVEYQGDPAVVCPKAKALQLSFSFKKLSLKAYRLGCENY